MITGTTHRIKPSCLGSRRRLFPGKSMRSDNQTSPRTFAKEVKTSAKTTSAKYTGLSMDEEVHRRIDLSE